ncbi:hypothetical protein [Agromyces kandeliae]|uniref:Uncharacterized protein n=1 Tax=Agromyces kandeliae TaxID=2666141 RepID=A0A6L5R5Z2_9MICO|nr:hypothetical protein [Agromyces kandeliae]MRX45300.1 hypothetical protein [Agromyces kandeliae]
MARRRHEFVDQQPLDPENDPYAAYLIWKAERDAEAAAVADDGAADGSDGDDDESEPPRGSWLRRLAARAHVNASRER